MPCHGDVALCFSFFAGLWNVPLRGKSGGEVRSDTKQNTVTLTWHGRCQQSGCTFWMRGISKNEKKKTVSLLQSSPRPNVSFLQCVVFIQITGFISNYGCMTKTKHFPRHPFRPTGQVSNSKLRVNNCQQDCADVYFADNYSLKSFPLELLWETEEPVRVPSTSKLSAVQSWICFLWLKPLFDPWQAQWTSGSTQEGWYVAETPAVTGWRLPLNQPTLLPSACFFWTGSDVDSLSLPLFTDDNAGWPQDEFVGRKPGTSYSRLHVWHTLMHARWRFVAGRRGRRHVWSSSLRAVRCQSPTAASAGECLSG